MQKIFTLAALFILGLANPAKTHAQNADVTDSLALVDLYNSTNGPNWTYPYGWLTSDPLWSWPGVTVNSDGRVTDIDLNNEALQGNLPASLGNLSMLNTLNLASNQLTGIPSELGKLDKLTYLTLNNNQLTGNIPTGLASLTNLVELHLSNNQFTGSIPIELANLTNLNILDLAHNQLYGEIPPQLGSLYGLYGYYEQQRRRQSEIIVPGLDLSYNNLTGSIPSELGNLKILVVDLSNNQLSGSIPPQLGTMGCYVLNLSHNQLSGNIPAELGGPYAPVRLDLSYNQLMGGVPASFGDLVFHSDVGPPVLLALNNNLLTGGISSPSNNSVYSAFYRDFNIYYNYLNFDSLETMLNLGYQANYAPQYTILPLHFSQKKLSVSAGGTVINNTYTWYLDGNLVATITGDSTYEPKSSGTYSVTVTNAVGIELALSSNTFFVSESALPLTFIQFTAQTTHTGNILQWQTGHEINSAYFNIQRSATGSGFANIGKVAAMGSGTPTQNYQYTDENNALDPITEKLYYRLQEVDKDGNKTYSKIIALGINGSTPAKLLIYPNPVRDVLNVHWKGDIGAANITVTYETGKTLLSKAVNAVNGQTFTLNTQHLAAGVYYVHLVQKGQGFVEKFVKY